MKCTPTKHRHVYPVAFRMESSGKVDYFCLLVLLFIIHVLVLILYTSLVICLNSLASIVS